MTSLLQQLGLLGNRLGDLSNLGSQAVPFDLQNTWRCGHPCPICQQQREEAIKQQALVAMHQAAHDAAYQERCRVYLAKFRAGYRR